MSLLIVLLLARPLFTTAFLLNPTLHDNNPHKRQFSTWYHKPDSPVHRLFRREQDPGTASFAPVGSPAWSSGFPKADSDLSTLPAAWKEALDAAVEAGKIPNIPASNNTPGTNPVYPAKVDPNSPDVCSATYKCRHPDDIWDAPDGMLGSGFDDGPQPHTPRLNDFLKSVGVITTHFVIGTNILYFPDVFKLVFEQGHDLAVHTWTHPYMTTLSNELITAEIGWTMQLICNSTGGLLPKIWRPPYGDADNRVRAIAKEVFDLTTVMWNHDTRDWSLITGGTTADVIHASMMNWTSASKSPGLIILEHETSSQAVDSFIRAYPSIKNNNWEIVSVARFVDGSAYRDPSSSAASSAPNLLNDSGQSTNLANGSSAASQSLSSTATPHNLASSQTSPANVLPNHQSLDSGAADRGIPLNLVGNFIIAALAVWL